MSKIECRQLHSELFGCRHSTLQLHGLFALAKPLLISDIWAQICMYATVCHLLLTWCSLQCVMMMKTFAVAIITATITSIIILLNSEALTGH